MLMIASLLCNIISAIDWTHKHGICHRDIKSDNVLLVEASSEPSGMIAKLTDFGLAKAKDSVGGSSSAGGGSVGLERWEKTLVRVGQGP